MFVSIIENELEKHFLVFDYVIKNDLENNLLIFYFFFKFIKRMKIKCKKFEGWWNWKKIYFHELF